jgi:protein TonB
MFNNSSNLYGGEWLALVFANRNQQYGAYKLRSQSSHTLLKAFFIAAPIFVAAFIGPSVISAMKKDKAAIVDAPVKPPVDVRDIIHEIKPKEEPKPAAKPVEQDAPKVIPAKVKSVAMSSNIKVVKDDLVTTPPPTTSELDNAVISSVSQDGLPGKINADIGPGKIGDGAGVGGNGTGGNEIYETAGVEVYPEFPGGMSAWAKYIQRNLRYPDMAQQEGIQGKVFLSFVVEKDGTITDAKVIRGIGYGCDAEALRVIKKSPRWKPGMQNNLPVRVRYNMPISYLINN